jgi:hypothetical protein
MSSLLVKVMGPFPCHPLCAVSKDGFGARFSAVVAGLELQAENSARRIRHSPERGKINLVFISEFPLKKQPATAWVQMSVA